jgi:hypothetical protein
MRLEATLGALAFCAALSAPAEGFVLSEDPFEETSTTLGVMFRSFGFLFAGDVLEPPYTATDMSPSGAAVFDSRLYFAHREPSFKIVFHDQLTLALSSHAAGPLGLGRGPSPPRWLPITFRHDDAETLTLTSNADWLYGAAIFGPVTIAAGRQPVTFGRGSLWRTMDRVSTFALTEVDTTYKPGADALRLDINATEKTVITAVAAIGELESDELDGEVELRGSTFVTRLKQGWDGGEVGFTGGFVRYDAVGSIDAVFDFGDFDLYGETTITRLTDKSLTTPAITNEEIPAVSALVGATFRPLPKLTVKPEVLYNGFGSFEQADYLPQLLSERVAIGEQVNVGRLYLGLMADHELTPLTHLVTTTIVNLHDPSALFSAALSYNMAENVDVILGGYVPAGKRPDVRTASAGSEFGTYPIFAFTELRGTL